MQQALRGPAGVSAASCWGLSRPRTQNAQRARLARRGAGGGAGLPLRAHALALQLALALQVRLVQLVRVRVQRADDAQRLRAELSPISLSV